MSASASATRKKSTPDLFINELFETVSRDLWRRFFLYLMFPPDDTNSMIFLKPADRRRKA
jgi:hypothetical protein